MSEPYQNLFLDDKENFVVQLYATSVKKHGHWLEKLLRWIGGVKLVKAMMRGSCKYVTSSCINSSSLGLTSQEDIIRVKAEILLHKNATNADIFRALVILHRTLWMIKAMSPNSPYTSEQVDPTVVMNTEVLPLFLKAARKYEHDWRDSIQQKFSQAGWIVTRYMYGTIRQRSIW
jgi:hypothetical protein